MPQVRFTPAALRDLQRLREFLRTKSPTAAKHPAAAIVKAIQMLGEHPRLGRPVPEMEMEFRELAIEFGDTGYIALYRFEAIAVTVLAIRHQKEAGH